MSAQLDPPLNPIMLAAQDAARALLVIGWPVLACEDDEGAWRIRDAILTHEELVSFAIWAPNPTNMELTASASSQARRDHNAPLDAAEALEAIRAVIGVMIEPTGDDRVVAFRLIRTIIGKASRTVED